MSAYLDTEQRDPSIYPMQRWSGQLTGLEQTRPRILEHLDMPEKLNKLSMQYEQLSQELQKLKAAMVVLVKLNFVAGRRLKTPLEVVIERDDEGFIARSVDLPLYGYGDDQYEALDCLKREIDSLYHDLMQDNEFTSEWLQIKKFLQENVLSDEER
jgi:hypothetical protein